MNELQKKSVKGELYPLLSKILDVDETYTLPSDLGELLNLYILKKTEPKNRNLFEDEMKKVQSSLSSRYEASSKSAVYVPINYSENDVISYVLYYFPQNFPKIQYILYDLIRYGNPDVLKKKEIKILDIGTGCGTIPISLSFFLKSIGDFEKLNVDIIESNKFFIAAFQDLKDIIDSKKFGVPIVCDKIISGSFEDKEVFEGIIGKYDFITFSNVLNESKLSTEELAEWIIKYKTKLNENGHLIIIEPEDKTRARRTTELRNVLIRKGIKDVYCIGENIWGDINNKNCPHWCAYKKLINIPENEGFFLISTYSKGINFSYLLTNKRGYVFSPNPNYTKLSDLKKNTWVDICGKVIERNDESPKVTHLFICDGTQKAKIFAFKFKPECHEKIEHIKINDVVIFKHVWVKEDPRESGLQIEIANSTETPRIIQYFE